MAPWASSSTRTFCILVDGPLTGAALNPARTMGPNLIANAFWSTPNPIIYFIAPFLGAAIVSMVWGGMAALHAPTEDEYELCTCEDGGPGLTTRSGIVMQDKLLAHGSPARGGGVVPPTDPLPPRKTLPSPLRKWGATWNTACTPLPELSP